MNLFPEPPLTEEHQQSLAAFERELRQNKLFTDRDIERMLEKKRVDLANKGTNDNGSTDRT